MEAEIARHELVYHLASAVGVKLIIERPVERATFNVVLPPLSDGALIRQPLGDGNDGGAGDSGDVADSADSKV